MARIMLGGFQIQGIWSPGRLAVFLTGIHTTFAWKYQTPKSTGYHLGQRRQLMETSKHQHKMAVNPPFSDTSIFCRVQSSLLESLWSSLNPKFCMVPSHNSFGIPFAYFQWCFLSHRAPETSSKFSMGILHGSMEDPHLPGPLGPPGGKGISGRAQELLDPHGFANARLTWRGGKPRCGHGPDQQESEPHRNSLQCQVSKPWLRGWLGWFIGFTIGSTIAGINDFARS